MLYNENVTVKQIVYLLISCGFQKCELWTEKAYINANHGTKRFRSHRIASKKMDLLCQLPTSEEWWACNCPVVMTRERANAIMIVIWLR